MISKDTTQLFDPDCSTCAHRVERHPSRRINPSKPRSLNYVCLVCAKAIGEHGCWMSHTEQVYGEDDEWLGFKSVWVQEVPCRVHDKELDKWVAIDYEPNGSLEQDGVGKISVGEIRD